MSNRSLVELDHDYCLPDDDAKLLAWARAMRTYMRAADPDQLPDGVVRKHYRHNSDPCPIDDLSRLQGALQKVSRGYPCETQEDMRRVAREALPPHLR